MVEVASWRLFAFKPGDGSDDVFRDVTEPNLARVVESLRRQGYDSVYLHRDDSFECEHASTVPAGTHFWHGFPGA